MGQGTLAIGQKLKFRGNHCEITRLLPDNKFRLQNVDYNEWWDVSQDELVKAWENEELIFPETGRHVKTVDGFGEYDVPEFEGLSEKTRKALAFKEFVIRPLIGLRGKERSESVDKRVEELKHPDLMTLDLETIEYIKRRGSPVRQTIYDWLRQYEQSQGDMRSLIPDYFRSGPGDAKRLDPAVEKIITEVLQRYVKSGEERTVDTVWADVYAKIVTWNTNDPSYRLEAPSESTIRRRIKELDPYEVERGRVGYQSAYDKFGNVKTKRRGKNPMDRVEVDHTTLNLFVVDEATRKVVSRVYLTTLMDTCTDYICGYHLSFDPSSSASVLYALKHAIRNKNYVQDKYPRVRGIWHFTGVPKVLVTDRGKDFVGKHVKAALMETGTIPEKCPPRCPWLKGQIERWFRTLNQDLIDQLPGMTGANAEARKKRNYDSEKNAVISMQALHEIIHIWIIDVYHKRKNRGVRGLPEDLWLKKTSNHSLNLPKRVNWERRIGKKHDGVIQDAGIRFKYLDYNSDELHRLRHNLLTAGKDLRVDFLYDAHDLGYIRVFDEFEDDYIRVPCRDFEYANGLTEFAHDYIIADMNKADRENRHQRALQKARIFKIVAEEAETTKRARALQQRGLKKEAVDRGDSQKPTQEEQVKKSAKVIRLYKIDTSNDDDWGGTHVRNYS